MSGADGETGASPLPRRRIGGSPIEVTVLGLGGAPLGNLFEVVPEDRANATVAAAHGAGIRWFDTAPFYGHGVSEHRFGHVLRQEPRDGFILSTKVGRLLEAARGPVESPFQGEHGFAVVHDYGYDATMRSLEDSWQRLGMARIDIALVHDVDPMHQGDDYDARFAQATTGACRALTELRAAGVIGAWGIGVNQVEPCLRFARETDLDAVMLARSLTLLEQSGVPELLEVMARRRASLLVAGPYGSGLLATGSEGASGTTHNYAPPEPATLERLRRIEGLCADHGVPLKAAALQFPLRHPGIAAVAAGAVAPEQPVENAAMMRHPVPDAFWRDLDGSGLVLDGFLAAGDSR